MVFIPLTKHVRYTPEYRTKLIANHDAYIGDETAISIRGLRDLQTDVKIITGDTITIHTLLKSLPATKGMSCPQLFQFVELNNAGTVVMGIYQACDSEYIKQRAEDIEKEIRDIIQEGEASKIFEDEISGISIGGTYKTKQRKILVANQPPKTTIDHINKINNVLHSPPKNKKRTNTNITHTDNIPSIHHQSTEQCQ